jgi:beta-galactosidase
VQSARPGRYPDDIYTVNGVSVWVGPPTPELSSFAIRKSFAHQLTKGSGIWWFDMWGGWFSDELLMSDMIKAKEIYDRGLSQADSLPSSEVVFFADEQSYANNLGGSPQLSAIKESRTAMGNAGAPYDSYAVEDAESVLRKYKAAVFPFAVPSDVGKRAMELCESLGIPYLRATEEHCELTKEEIREFYSKAGVHLYTDEFDVVYVGNGYAALHSAVGGTKTLKLPGVFTVTPVFGTEASAVTSDAITFELKENGTALFALS